MKNNYKIRIFSLISMLILFVATNVTNAQTIVYVSSDGSGDGSSWASSASDIQGVINNATGETQIWIKAGTYYVPGDTLFTLKEGVSLYGGFEGTETNLLQRKNYRMQEANETILSGDIDKNNITDAGNARRVMYGEDITSATVLSGLTIKGGYAAESGDDGGGLRLNGGSMLIDNCTFTANYCDDNAAGLYMYGSATPTITNCYFTANEANDKGGATYTATGCDAQFINCVFENNSAATDAGAVRVYKSAPTFMNCTFVRNALASGDGAALDANSDGANPTIVNCIFWGNTVGGVTEIDIALSSSTALATITTCALEGTYTTEGATASGIIDISSTDPLFTNTSGTAGVAGYDAAADWSLQTGSTLINAGLATGAPAMDINSNFRDATPDLGAYENNAEVPFIIATDISGEGSISPNGTYVKSGEDQDFVLTPETGYEITTATFNSIDILASLVDNGDGSFTYTASAVAADGILAVGFTPLPVKYTLSVSAGDNGTIEPSGDMEVTVTDTKVFTITPASNYTVDDILLNGSSVLESLVDNGDNTFTYTLTGVGENSTLEVSFIAVYNVTISSGNNGSISEEGEFSMRADEEKELIITPAGGFTIDAFTVNSADASGDIIDNGDGTYTYTITGLTENTTINATFTEYVGNILYVKEGGSGDGSSWANASGSLQDIIFASGFGDEVWIAKGIYTTPGVDSSFTIANGVSLYGGFAGTETDKSQRRKYRFGEANETKLSADLDGNGFLTGGNGSRVIFGEFLSSTTTIDGITFTGGFSDEEGSNGAAMKLRASSPNIINCTFFDNYCDDGAAIYLYRSGDDLSSPIINGCVFMKNFANDDGGAIYAASGTMAKFINCQFSFNFANDEGGAIRNYECSPSYINCTFTYNSLPDTDPGGGGTYGPAIRNYQSSSPYMNCEPKIINCVFWQNLDGSETTSYDISNTGNLASAGVFVTVKNCALDSVSGSSCTVIDTVNVTPYNLSGTNIGFANVSGTPGYQGYDAAADWNLTETSILIGEGTASEDDVPLTDIRGLERGAQIDIGAYEYGEYIGIAQREVESWLLAYPNPGNGQFYVKSENNKIISISVIDITGKLVYSLDNADAYLVPLDLSSNPAGLYFIRVMNQSGMTSTLKLLIE